MTKQVIDNGTVAGDGTGENLFDAFAKVNENFTELYVPLEVAKTATYSVLATETRTHFKNTSAAAIIEFDLPAATVGLSYVFRRDNATYALRVDPNGTELFLGSLAGKYKSLNTDGSYMKIECFKAGTWHVTASYGVISDE